jgi:indole-3-glycerol phosphate synthase
MERSILDRIVAQRLLRLADAMLAVPVTELEKRCAALPAPRDFKTALRHNRYGIIAEIKKGSPSRGMFDPKLDPTDVARSYERGGADAISIVTEPDFFHGALKWLQHVRAATAVPLLRKDFVFCEYQVWETRAAGADAILLILSILDDQNARQLIGLARQVGLYVLVEVHDEIEAKRACDLGAEIVGVNNRDLKTFDISLETSARLFSHLPPNAVKVSESGILTHADCERLRTVGYNAFLVGEALMTAPDVGAALRALRGEHAAR